MSSGKLTDSHIIYCNSGIATYEQISNTVKRAILEAEKQLKQKVDCKYKINLLVGKNGEYFGYAYIWISSPKIYWMLLGKNPDGSERFEEIPDPNWKAPEKKEGIKTWGEIADENIHPKIREPLPSLIQALEYFYEEDQLSEGELNLKKGRLDFGQAYVSDVSEGLVRNRIFARNVPNWIPLDVFKSIFSFYPSAEPKKGKKDYPMVTTTESKKMGRMVFITFDPSTNHALFTLLMTKKLVLVNPENREQKATLVFSHSAVKK